MIGLTTNKYGKVRISFAHQVDTEWTDSTGRSFPRKGTRCVAKTDGDEPEVLAVETSIVHPNDVYNYETGRKESLTQVVDKLFGTRDPERWDVWLTYFAKQEIDRERSLKAEKERQARMTVAELVEEVAIRG